MALKLIQMRFGSVHPSMGVFFTFVALGLLMIPSPSGLKGYAPAAFPMNMPMWSLFLEIVANVGHALFFRRKAWTFLAGVLVLSGSAMIWSVGRLGTMDFGWKRADTLYGMLRVVFSYTCGILLFRLWKTGRFRVQVHPLALAACLLLLLAAPLPGGLVKWYGLFVTICVFPALVLISASSKTSARLMPVASLLGTLSYALYVLHDPIADNFNRFWFKFRGHLAGVDAPWSGCLYAVITLTVALVVDFAYDLPLRNFLRVRLQSGKVSRSLVRGDGG